MKIYKTEDILGKLENAIKYKKPFSHIRFGDGGIKFLHAMLFNDKKQLDIIIKKEGIPRTKLAEVFELWGYYSRHADFIDTPEIYFRDTFWDRTRGPGKPVTEKTEIRLRMWKDLYERSEFDTKNYCNPESNYLMVTKIKENRTLVDIMKNKKIGLITACPKVKTKLSSINVDIYTIVGHFKNQYANSFKSIVKAIERNAKKYDFWLVAAGELGRLYSGLIKENGGRTIDIGFIVEFWLGEEIHPRLHQYLRRRWKSPLELELTFLGKKYEEYI
jgi:hypothetical protein